MSKLPDGLEKEIAHAAALDDVQDQLTYNYSKHRGSRFYRGAAWMFSRYAVLIEALEFYGDIDTWHTTDGHKTYQTSEGDLGDGSFFVSDTDSTSDDRVAGKRAREALAKFKGDL